MFNVNYHNMNTEERVTFTWHTAEKNQRQITFSIPEYNAFLKYRENVIAGKVTSGQAGPSIDGYRLTVTNNGAIFFKGELLAT